MAKILLADHDKEKGHAIAAMFRRAGHAVEVFDDGHEALGAVDRTRFDLMLAGVAVPGIDGIALAQEVYRTNPDLKIMLIAGFVALHMKPRKLRNGHRVPVISHPIHLRKVVQTLPEMLRMTA